MYNADLFVCADSLQNMMVARATGGVVQDRDYVEARERLVQDPSIDHLLPVFVKTCRLRIPVIVTGNSGLNVTSDSGPS